MTRRAALPGYPASLGGGLCTPRTWCAPAHYGTGGRGPSDQQAAVTTQTRLYVGYVPGFAGAHSQGETLEELNDNLREAISMLLEDREPAAVWPLAPG